VETEETSIARQLLGKHVLWVLPEAIITRISGGRDRIQGVT
jgi:hypothetical protein